MSKKNDMLSETAVHDYVSGYMSKDRRENFEKLLASDKSLQNAVETERHLRTALLNYDRNKQKPLGLEDSSIDALFSTIDELGDGQPNNTQSPWFTRNWYAVGGVAASVMLAIVMFVDNSPREVNTDFTLLNDSADEAKIDFNDLVDAKKIAQLWLVKDLSETELSKLFSEHDLKPIGRAGSAWIVASSRTLSDLHLSSLAAEDSVEQISLISYNDKARIEGL